MKFYSTTVTAKFKIEVEAESDEEAERIIDGVLDNASDIYIFEDLEGTPDADVTDQLASEGELALKRGDIEPIENGEE